MPAGVGGAAPSAIRGLGVGSEGRGDGVEPGEFCSQAVSCLAGGLHGESAEKTHPGLKGPVPACSLASHWTESSAPTQGLVETCMGNWSMSGQQLGWKEMRLAVAKNSQDTGPPSKATPLTTNRRVRGSIPGSETPRSCRPSLASPEQDAQALGVSGGAGVARTPPMVGNSFRECTQDDTSHDPLPDFPGLQVSRLQPRPNKEDSFLERSHSALFSPLPPLLSPSPFLSLSSPYSALLSSPQTPLSVIFSC